MKSNVKQKRPMSSLLHHIKNAISASKSYNSSQVVAPNVILWPDPEKQWLPIIKVLRKEIPAFLTLGNYQPDISQGPAIWIKCMVNKALPEADWSANEIPVIYLPGISKADFKNIEEAAKMLQPLMEYQFTGNLWLQENGREWSILAFMQNQDQGMALNIARDSATKDALLKSLPKYFQEEKSYFKGQIDADFLNQKLIPHVIPNILKWMEHGDKALVHLSAVEVQAFKDVVESQYGLQLNHSLVLDFAFKLGVQKESWFNVWQYFANAPQKFPKIIEYLEKATPKDLGTGMFQLPAESWPAENKNKEADLKIQLEKLAKYTPAGALKKLTALWDVHKERLPWIWTELGFSPLAESLPHIIKLAKLSLKAYNNSSITGITDYYKSEGYQIDAALRQLFKSTSKENKKIFSAVSDLFYRPWIEKLTNKFQELVKENVDEIIDTDFANKITGAQFILFVDAFRYDLALEFCNHLSNNYKVELNQTWSALPSLTATSKPSVSPISELLSQESSIKDFQPNFNSGNPCTAYYFKKELSQKGVQFISGVSEIKDLSQQHWMEIGDIDKKGHQEQSDMFKRIPSLLQELKETINNITEKGITKITIVTDHGWLLLPNGLPSEKLHKDLSETRWGRCAEMKTGATTDNLQLPWTWNPNEYIAYASGISFFKKNEEYAHGGISIHECMTPLITITSEKAVTTEKAVIEDYKWVGMRVLISTHGTIGNNFNIDVRLKREDANSSIKIGSVKQKDADWKMMADGDYEGQAGYIVLLDSDGILVDSKLIEIGR